jgi:hypothetical protein
VSEPLACRLTTITPLLADILDFDTFRGHLIRNRGISWSQYETLMAERVEYDRNVQLIDTLQHGSLRSLLLTTEALKACDNKYIGQYLIKGKTWRLKLPVLICEV